MNTEIVVKQEFPANKLKDWQAEAFIFCVLFCCKKYPGKISRLQMIKPQFTFYDWDMNRIHYIMETYGDIFKLPIVDKVRHTVIKHDLVIKDKDFIKNLRMTPESAKQELYNVCTQLFSINHYEEDDLLVKLFREDMG